MFLHEDRAAALGRIGGTLQSLIDALNATRAQLGAMPDAHRALAVARYQALREKARTYRWYLEVQREAIGLTQHDVIDRLYPIPPEEPL